MGHQRKSGKKTSFSQESGRTCGKGRSCNRNSSGGFNRQRGLSHFKVGDARGKEVSLSGKIEQKKEEKGENYYYAERAYSGWERTIPLPVRIQSDKAKAKYQNGVLEITLPKAEEAKKKRKELKIE